MSETNSQTLRHCDQCSNQCPADALRCNRGRLRFGLEPVEPKFPAGPLGLLQKCGFVLHHGDLEPETALSALPEQDQAELERMLSALLADWEKRMPEGLPRRGRHGRGPHGAPQRNHSAPQNEDSALPNDSN